MMYSRPTYDELWSYFGSADKLPQASASPLQLSSLLDSSEASNTEIEALIQSDPALTASILKAASSAAYGRTKPVTTIREAVMVLGFRAIRYLAVALWTTALLTETQHDTHFDPKRFANNGVFIGTLAAKLFNQSDEAKASGWTTEEMYAAGILSNIPIGLISLMAPGLYNELFTVAQAKECSLEVVFNAMYGKPLNSLGIHAMTVLGIPEAFIHAQGHLDHPESAEEIAAPVHILAYSKLQADYCGFGVSEWEIEFSSSDPLWTDDTDVLSTVDAIAKSLNPKGLEKSA
ncbi:MAG: HDOD domain-containing protein [Fimbriimonadaceae bacterium]